MLARACRSRAAEAPRRTRSSLRRLMIDSPQIRSASRSSSSSCTHQLSACRTSARLWACRSEWSRTRRTAIRDFTENGVGPDGPRFEASRRMVSNLSDLVFESPTVAHHGAGMVSRAEMASWCRGAGTQSAGMVSDLVSSPRRRTSASGARFQKWCRTCRTSFSRTGGRASRRRNGVGPRSREPDRHASRRRNGVGPRFES